MKRKVTRIFSTAWPTRTDSAPPGEVRWGLYWGDSVIIFALLVILFFNIRLAVGSPQVIEGSHISLSPNALPIYAWLSVARMSLAYILSVGVALVYGYMAANSSRGQKILIPLLDILQSVPILSFLPVALLSLSAIFPTRIAAEFASVALIFTCQAWNLIMTWYQALTTVPRDLTEVSKTFRFNTLLTLRTLQLPLAANGLIWNSMMSWAGGWFFLMAAETFSVGDRDFRLPGIGSYLQEAANQGDYQAIAWGGLVLVCIIVLMDQLLWRPLICWSDKFRLEMTQSDDENSSWFYQVAQHSRIAKFVCRAIISGIDRILERVVLDYAPHLGNVVGGTRRTTRGKILALILIAATICYSCYWGGTYLTMVKAEQWQGIVLALGATFIRVTVALVLALLWTIPVGVLIGSSRRLASWLQPVVQIVASVPSTALFPLLLMILLTVPAGLNIAAILLMMMGAQWYILFNVIAGTHAVPNDLRYTSLLLRMNRRERWRSLVLPSIMPYVVTGGITASGGAWNTSVVAEFVHFGGRIVSTQGIGSVIADATARGDYPLLLAATLSMSTAVVLINRLFWRRLFRLAEERYRLD